MHIPDGMLDTRTWVTAAAASTGTVAYAVRQARRKLAESRIVLMSVLAAMIFALQLLNFPVAGGTSGHFAGGAAAAILLGPWPAVLIMTSVLSVQAFLFADGGITALGANVLNMAIIGPFVGWWVYSAISRGGRAIGRRPVAAFVAGWTSALLAAVAVALELAASGRAPLGIVLGSMAFWHALIGIGEGFITAGLVAYVTAVRPDLVSAETPAPRARWRTLLVGGTALVAASLSFAASRFPDALARVSSGLGVASSQVPKLPTALLRDYSIPGVSDPRLAAAMAGILGAAIVGSVLFALIRIGGARRTDQKAAEAADSGFHRHAHRHADEPPHVHPHHHAVSTEADAPPAHGHSHALGFERYTCVVSPIHSLDPRAKILCALAVVLTIVLLPPLPLLAFVALFLVLMAVTLLARLPVGYVLGRAALVLPFAGTIAFLAPLSAAGGSLNWAGITGAYSNGGWAIAYGVLGKAWLSVFVVVLLSATTPVPKLFRALQALRLPDIFLTMLSFVYRYVGAMRDQITSMRRALDSRAPGLSRRGRVRLYGHLAGNMFLRSYERGERVYAAMVSRGYDGSLPSSDLLRLGGGDAVLAAATLTCIAVLVAFSATGSVIL